NADLASRRATTCLPWKSPVSPGPACTPVPGANGAVSATCPSPQAEPIQNEAGSTRGTLVGLQANPSGCDRKSLQVVAYGFLKPLRIARRQVVAHAHQFPLNIRVGKHLAHRCMNAVDRFRWRRAGCKQTMPLI